MDDIYFKALEIIEKKGYPYPVGSNKDMDIYAILFCLYTNSIVSGNKIAYLSDKGIITIKVGGING